MRFVPRVKRKEQGESRRERRGEDEVEEEREATRRRRRGRCRGGREMRIGGGRRDEI